jgi:FixJ family two-component response regulator
MRALVCVVDDDESVRESLPDLLREFGFLAQAFSSGPAFLESDSYDECDCLLLDVAMPEMTGPELQQVLKRQGRATPIVYITAHADNDVRPRLLAEGAVECLFKPFSQTDLLNALNRAIGKLGDT